MRIERLVTETEFHSVALDFHPRLTVIGGLDARDREELVDEVLAGLAGVRSGIHLELLADSGSRFAVFRPSAARHRIVEIDTRLDVTESFADADGRIDLLRRSDLDVESARCAVRLTAADLVGATDHDRMIQSLANANQSELWVAADELAASQRQLEAEATAAAAENDDNDAADELERRHEALESLRRRAEQLLKATAIAGAVAVLATILGVVFGAPVIAAPPAAIAVALAARVLLMRRQIQTQSDAEANALAEFGAQSYLGFHIQRVNGLFDSDQARRSLMAAAEAQRAAFGRWTQVAGTAELAWALRHRGEIDAAARTRREVFGSDTPTETVEGPQVIQTAHAIVRRLGELRHLGVGDESFLALLDEPFEGLSDESIPPLLELLVRSSEHQQIVLLTDSPAVVSWAKVESMTGGVSLLEPNGATTPPPAPPKPSLAPERLAAPADESPSPN